MDLTILNTNLESVKILDTFESIIWTDRYCGYGDFEIYTSANDEALVFLKDDYYIRQKDSEHVMIIEVHQKDSDAERGDTVKVTGRSLECILDRRIVWVQTILSGNFQDAIQKLLNENAISPTIESRKISRLVFEASTDPIITALTVHAQFTGDNLYDAIQKLCTAKNIGFKITLNDSGAFVFKLYAGVDRSYDQLTNPYVVFSPKFENIVNSSSIESKKTLKTVTLVAGEGEGSARKTTVVEATSGGDSDLSRRELFTDAKDISSTVNNGTLTDAEYTAQMKQRGTEKLAENVITKSFEGQVDTTRMYKYGKDFFMGDIVQLVSDDGIESTERVTEFVHSQSTSGVSTYPTFSAV